MAENCNLHPQAEMGTRQMGNVGFVCFGEVNTPFERLQIKHDAAQILANACGKFCGWRDCDR